MIEVWSSRVNNNKVSMNHPILRSHLQYPQLLKKHHHNQVKNKFGAKPLKFPTAMQEPLVYCTTMGRHCFNNRPSKDHLMATKYIWKSKQGLGVLEMVVWYQAPRCKRRIRRNCRLGRLGHRLVSHRVKGCKPK